MRPTAILVAASLALAACSSGYGANNSAAYYPSSSCSGPSTGGILGGLAGAAGGALLGNQFGKGSGKDLATAGGALAGGGGGYMAGQSMSGC